MYLIKQKQGSSITTFFAYVYTFALLSEVSHWAGRLLHTHLFLTSSCRGYFSLLLQTLCTTDCLESLPVFCTSLFIHTAQVCLPGTMTSSGLRYTDFITITTTTDYHVTPIKELFSGGSCCLYCLLLFVLSNLFILYIKDRHKDFSS